MPSPNPRIRQKWFAARLCSLLMALLLVCLTSGGTSADAQPADPATSDAAGRSDIAEGALAALEFGTGILAAYAIHEAGHWAAAAVTGTELHWESGTYNQPLGFTEDADSDTNGAVLYGAGLAAQALCGEVILAADSIDKTHPLVRGMMFWNVANPVIYAVDYWFLGISNQINTDGYQGDLAGIEHYAGKDAANTFAAASAALALWQGFRFWKAQHRPAAPANDGLQVGIAPASRGGAVLSVRLSF